MNDNITPVGVVTGAARWMWVAIIALALIVGLSIAGWRLGWWFTAQNVNRQAHIIQNGYANQTALHSEITQGIANVTTITIQMDAASGQQLADLHAQRLAVAGTTCGEADQVSAADPLPADQQAWITRNCSAGTVSAGSPLRK